MFPFDASNTETKLYSVLKQHAGKFQENTIDHIIISA